jgi:hypothetical protein
VSWYFQILIDQGLVVALDLCRNQNNR